VTAQQRLTFYLSEAVSKALKSERKLEVSTALQSSINPAISALIEIVTRESSSTITISTAERLAGLSLLLDLYKIVIDTEHKAGRRRNKYETNAIAKKRVLVQEKQAKLAVAAEHERIERILRTAEETR
jgi:hypothetical protein